MKWRTAIAALCAGLVLGTAGTAVATGGYWNQAGRSYTCEGITSGVYCKSGGYEIGITQSFVYVQKGHNTNTAPVYACRKWQPWSACVKS